MLEIVGERLRVEAEDEFRPTTFAAHPTGYPSAGCSPALPVSVSPASFICLE